MDAYQKADADLHLSRAEVEKQRMNSTMKSQQYDDAKNEYANQLQKTNAAQVSYTKNKHYMTKTYLILFCRINIITTAYRQCSKISKI